MPTTLPTSDFAEQQDSYLAPTAAARGGARSAFFQPPDYSLWQLTGELDSGTELVWTNDHGDEAVYVVDGAIEVDGTRVGSGGAVLIEATVPATVRAVAPTRVAHFGPTDHDPPRDGPFGPAAARGRQIHVFPTVEAAPGIIDTHASGRYFGDGTCSTCRITFFVFDGRGLTEGYTGTAHTHSEDEIIHMLDGELQMGPTTLTPGVSVAIPANRLYSFRTPAGFRFVNYRRDAAYLKRGRPGSTPTIETVEALRAMTAERGIVGTVAASAEPGSSTSG
jgi:quercetin dioxygenase-like cupin family protein